MKIDVVTNGTGHSLAWPESFVVVLTVVDIWHTEVGARYRRRIFVKTLEPEAHGQLGTAIVPDDIQQGFATISEVSSSWTL
jgi:hypothetical protein